MAPKNANEICRLCLKKSDRLYALLDTPLLIRIRAIFQIEFSESSPNMPRNACIDCYDFLHQIETFKEMIANNQSILSQYGDSMFVQNIKEEEIQSSIGEYVLEKHEESDVLPGENKTVIDESQVMQDNIEIIMRDEDSENESTEKDIETEKDNLIISANIILDPKEIQTLLSSRKLKRQEPHNEEVIITYPTILNKVNSKEIGNNNLMNKKLEKKPKILSDEYGPYPTYPCNKQGCDRVYKYQSSLWAHQRNHENLKKSPTIICKYCKNNFGTSTRLKIHHSSQNSLCARTFRPRYSEQKVHKNSIQEENFICE